MGDYIEQVRRHKPGSWHHHLKSLLALKVNYRVNFFRMSMQKRKQRMQKQDIIKALTINHVKVLTLLAPFFMPWPSLWDHTKRRCCFGPGILSVLVKNNPKGVSLLRNSDVSFKMKIDHEKLHRNNRY
jgi:hypothetical protein